MNEVSLRITAATLAADLKLKPDEYKELCYWLTSWIKEGHELDLASSGYNVTTLQPVN